MSYRTTLAPFIAALTAALTIVACSDERSAVEPTPLEEPPVLAPSFEMIGATKKLLITAVGLDFGEVQVGTTSPSQTVRVQNVSGAPLLVNMTGGAPFGPGFQASQSCAGVTLAPNAACQLTYAFRPSAPGEMTSNSIGTANGQDFNIELRGTAVGARFRAPNVGLDFGDVQIGSTQSQTVTFTNIGRATVTVAAAGGAPANSVFGGSQSCAGTTLAINATCQFTYTFRPTAAGEVSSNTNGTMSGQPFAFMFKGNGVAPSYRVSPTSIDFGQVRVGQTVSVPVTVTNIGIASVVVSAAGGAAPGFGGFQSCAGVTLAIGASCQFTYSFSPTATGVVTGSTNGNLNGQNFNFTFRGEGIGAAASPTDLFRITQRALDFGEVQVGGQQQLSVTFTNISGASITGSIAGGAAGVFGGAQNCAGTVIPPGGSCQIFYTFQPSAAGEFTESTNGTMNGQPFALTFKGKAVSARFRMTPSSIDFGRVQTGQSLTIPVTFTNVGRRAVSGSIAGGAAVGFGGAQNCQGAMIPVGGSCQVFYTFSPTAAGETTGSTNGSMNGHAFAFTFKGTGVAPTFRITPYAFDFGEIAVGASSTQQAVTVTNIGTAAISGSIAGGAAAEFGGAQNCQSVNINVGQSCQIFYQFSPSIVGPITRTTNGSFNGQQFAFRFYGSGLGNEEAMDLSPTTVSLANTATISAVLLSSSTLDATTVNIGNVRMLVNTSIDVRPVSRGTAVVTSTRDFNGDGRMDRMFTFATSDLVAAGLTTTPGVSALILRDNISSSKWQARDAVLPTIVP
jgi:hypothetical protein